MVMKKYIKLLRIKHYFKNLLIFLPLFFGKKVFTDSIFLSIAGFVAFCFCSSSIYIINDLCDIEKDRQHPKKCKRPIANGDVKIKTAIVITVVLFVAAISIQYVATRNLVSLIYLLAYFVLNIGYSLYFKNIPIVDIVILASGFVIRVLFGGQIAGIKVSEWLFLTIMSASLFMGLGKRRNEIIQQKSKGETRPVLKYYNEDFLNKFMYLCLAIAICFYSLWAINFTNKRMIWTVPIVIVLAMKYCLDIESDDSDGDPIEVIFKDKILILLSLLYGFTMCTIIYL